MLQIIRIMAQWKNVIEVSYVVKGEKLRVHIVPEKYITHWNHS